ncbi:hypothetical protein Psta_2105 [Pirellula staleyi DSM 6068]|uniref:Uncharacterized protein n=1 Tax=Pirellula staleyi (strain ATCC 27377 / DSM 6068 / ICPB 4128) TaxID=530564 RepID=D2R1R0_PIRSD|nr:hypothetical protein [Pirellula staleyi]ADB16779.1 hypothetical protein Psta_2105 [Pirellula staleyi DSM 6068]
MNNPVEFSLFSRHSLVGRMKWWAQALLWLSATAALLIIAATVIAYLQSQTVPEFYAEAEVVLEPEVLKQNADELEREILDLSSKLRHDGNWELRLSDDQINSWLKVDLPVKFPDSLPPDVSQPRVAIEEDRAFAAARAKVAGTNSIVSIEAEPFVTQVPHELAVRLLAVRLGVMRVPMRKVLDQITRAAAEHGVVLRWDETQGDPVAIIDLRSVIPHDQPQIELTGIVLTEGEIIISGRTLDETPPN